MNNFYKNLICFFKDTILNEKTSKKEKIIAIFEFPFKRIPLFIIISTFILWFFDDKIAGFLNEQLVNPYLHLIKKENISDNAMYCFIGIVILFWSSKILRKYIYSNKAIALYTYAFIVYVCYRVFSDKWTFLYFKWEIAYLDIIASVYIAILIGAVYKSIIFINNYKKEIKGSALLLGEPLEDELDDILDYNEISSQIANELRKLQNNKSFAIGITKKWGNGKSSFLYFLKLNLKKKQENKKIKDAIILDFSPWFCKSEIDIISNFFDILSKQLKPFHSSLNNQITKYTKLILSLEKNILNSMIDKGVNLLTETSDIKNQYDNINSSIASLNRKIYIIIDDIDRLYAKELIECLKIIRNTANFCNVVFIVAYDPEYVQKALKKELSEYSDGYMDKIIQLHFELPEIESNKIEAYIRKEIKLHLIKQDFEIKLREDSSKILKHIIQNDSDVSYDKSKENSNELSYDPIYLPKFVYNNYKEDEIYDRFISDKKDEYSEFSSMNMIVSDANKDELDNNQIIIDEINIKEEYTQSETFAFLKKEIQNINKYYKINNSKFEKSCKILFFYKRIIDQIDNSINNEVDKIFTFDYTVPREIEKQNKFEIRGTEQNLDISKYFTNIRDCNKVINTFFTYRVLSLGHIEDSDLFLTCILKIKYPEQARTLYNNLDKFFIFENNTSINNFKTDLELSTSYITKEIGMKDNDIIKKDIFEDLKANRECIELICAIFFKIKKTIKSAGINHNYRTYYNGVVSSLTLPTDRYEKALKSQKNMISLIIRIKENQRTDLYYKLINNSNNTDVLIILSGLISFKIFKYNYKSFNKKTVHNVSNFDLIKFLKKDEDNFLIVLERLSREGDRRIIKEIASLISAIKFNYLLEKDFVLLPYKEYREEDENLTEIINSTKETLCELSINLFQKSIEESSKASAEEVYQIYLYCYSNLKHIKNKLLHIMDKKANKMISEYAYNNPIKFLKSIQFNEIYKTTISHPLDQAFLNEIGDFTNFEKFMNETIEDNPNLLELKEIKDKWFIYKENNKSSLRIDEYENSIANKEHA